MEIVDEADIAAISDELANSQHSDQLILGGPFTSEHSEGDPFLDVDGDGGVDQDDLDYLSEFIEFGTIADGLYQTRPTTRYYYDDANNLRFVIDPMQRATEYQYDARDRLIYEIGEQPTGVPSLPDLEPLRDPQGLRDTNPVMEYVWDAANRLDKEISHLSSSEAFTYEYAYDDLDRLITETLPDPDPQQNGSDDIPQRQYLYDLVGNRTSVVDPEGHTTLYAFDDIYRLTTMTGAEVINGWHDPEDPQTLHLANPVTTYKYDSAQPVGECH